MLLKFRQLILLLLLPVCSAYAALNNNNDQQATDLSSLSTAGQKAQDSQFSVKQQKRLDMLFTRLAGSDNEGAAKQLIAEIWSI